MGYVLICFHTQSKIPQDAQQSQAQLQYPWRRLSYTWDALMVKSAQILLSLIRVFSHPKGAEALKQVTDTQASLMTERIFFS